MRVKHSSNGPGLRQSPDEFVIFLNLCDRAINDLCRTTSGLRDWRFVNAAKAAIHERLNTLKEKGGRP